MITFRMRMPERSRDMHRAELYVCIVEKAPKWTCSKCGKQMYDAWMACSACKHPRPHTAPCFIAGVGQYGPLGFPKGGREAQDEGSIRANALREWDEETGISRARLQIISGRYVDDTNIGARMLVAICSLGNGLPDPESDCEVAWVPPEGDVTCASGHRLRAIATGGASMQCKKCVKYHTHCVMLTCIACRENVCKSCQDPDPIRRAHWMQMDTARRHMNAQRGWLLEQASSAIVDVHSSKLCKKVVSCSSRLHAGTRSLSHRWEFMLMPDDAGVHCKRCYEAAHVSAGVIAAKQWKKMCHRAHGSHGPRRYV